MGIITSMTMIGPLLLDIARDLRLPLGQASVLAVVSAGSPARSSPLFRPLSPPVRRRPLVLVFLSGRWPLGPPAPLSPRLSAARVCPLLARPLESAAPPR